jgi:hypothetical protein
MHLAELESFFARVNRGCTSGGMDSEGCSRPLTLFLQPAPAEHRKGIAMTPPTSPQLPPHEPPHSLSARSRRPGAESTWELPVQQPHDELPPMTRSAGQETDVSARRLWAGGGATAVVAAGIGVVGVLLIRGLLGIPILSAKGQLVDQAMAVVPISAALAALVATALLHLLLLTTPRPTAFFGAICAIVVAIMVIQVFLVGGTTEQQVATSVLYVVIGVGISCLLSGVARTSVRAFTRSGNAPW